MTSGRTVHEALAGRTFDFACTSCGRCCSGPGEVYFTDEDLENIFTYLQLDRRRRIALKKKLIQFRRKGLNVHSSGKVCLFLKNNQCSVYPVRPMQCSTFPFWPSNFQSAQSLEELKQECPGSLKGTGADFSFYETVRLIRRTERNFLSIQNDSDNPMGL